MTFPVSVFCRPQLLKRGCHVNDRDGLTDMTLLHYSCKAGAHGVGELLYFTLSRDALMHISDENPE